MKVLLSIFALLLSVTMASAQSQSHLWDFTKFLSEADEEDIKYDKEYLDEDGPTEVTTWYRTPMNSTTTGAYRSFRYGIGQEIAESVENEWTNWFQLSANGNVLDYTRGIYFARFDGPIGVKSLRIEPGNRFNLNVSKLGLKFPDLKAGDVIRILFSTSSKKPEQRFFSITNGHSTEEDPTRISSADSKSPTLGEITVDKDGDVVLMNSKSMYIYKISINETL